MQIVAAVIVAQALDPVRAGLLALVMWLASRTEWTAARWSIIVAGIVAIAVAIPLLLLGHTGQMASVSVVVGIVSNALVAAAMFGLWRLFRRRF